MKNSSFWALPWLCLWLYFTVVGCMTTKNITEQPQLYQVKIAFVSNQNEASFSSVFSGLPVSHIDFQQHQPSFQTIVVTVRGERSLNMLKQKLACMALPIIKLEILKQ